MSMIPWSSMTMITTWSKYVPGLVLAEEDERPAAPVPGTVAFTSVDEKRKVARRSHATFVDRLLMIIKYNLPQRDRSREKLLIEACSLTGSSRVGGTDPWLVFIGSAFQTDFGINRYIQL